MTSAEPLLTSHIYT